ncbi:MAG: hypothetical protein U1F16_02175 [Turneriella sp.]
MRRNDFWPAISVKAFLLTVIEKDVANMVSHFDAQISRFRAACAADFPLRYILIQTRHFTISILNFLKQFLMPGNTIVMPAFAGATMVSPQRMPLLRNIRVPDISALPRARMLLLLRTRQNPVQCRVMRFLPQ